MSDAPPTALIPTIPPDTLMPWEERFAQWLALQPSKPSLEDQQDVIEALAGERPSQNLVKTTRRKLPFRKAYQQARGELMDLQLQEARAYAMQTAPRAMKVYDKTVRALDRELDRALADEDADRLAVIRTAPSVLNPFLDRVSPKRAEGAVQQTAITITLSAAQLKGLDEPVVTVEAHEVIVKPATGG